MTDSNAEGTGPGTAPAGPRVGLIMGSDSDWPTMEAAAEALAEFGVPFEVGVVSAHRTPQRMLDYAAGAAGRGISVIIAGAGAADIGVSSAGADPRGHGALGGEAAGAAGGVVGIVGAAAGERGRERGGGKRGEEEVLGVHGASARQGLLSGTRSIALMESMGTASPPARVMACPDRAST